MREVTLIWAQARDGVIGKDNTIPWHIPEDMAFFKENTVGRPVVMGRLTWDSLPPKFRPLPGRRNIVVTRNPEWTAEGAEVAPGLAEALALAGEDEPEVVVMGGGQIYAQAMAHATQLLVTEVDVEVDGDAVAPQVGPEWSATVPGDWRVSSNGIAFRWIRYSRS